MLYFWILTVILFALPVLLAVMTWNQSQAEARACVVRWQVIASIVYFLATSPMNLTTDTIFVILLLGALIAATALLVRHYSSHGYRPF